MHGGSHEGGTNGRTAANPFHELSNVAKNIADCTELHLARRGIAHLTDDMEAFESLEVLWLNDNALSRITDLDFNSTIKGLYAHNNRISTLKGSLLAFTFLHTLTLGNNRLDDLQGSLGILRLLRHLRYLELAGNPLAEETGYRLLVIKNVPWLETLDMHKITEDERQAARRARTPKSWAATSQGRSADIVGLTQDLAAKEELSRMRAVVKKRRILLKHWFRAEDSRREEAVTEGMFTLCLNLHGLWPKADSADPNDDSGYGVQPGEDERSCRSSAALGEEGVLRGMILEAFRTATPPRAPFLGRDPPYLRQRFVDYVKFCAAVEPKCGGRDVDNQARELDKAWREKRPPRGFGGGGTTSLAAGGAAEQVGLYCDMMQEAEEVRNERLQRLDQWERLELRHALEAEGTHSAGATGDSDQRNQKSTSRTAPAPVAISKPRVVVTRAQALSALHKMEEIQGKRAHIFNLEPPPSVDEDSVFNQLSIAASGSGGGGGACGTGGSDDPVATPTNFDVMFDAAAAMTLLSRAASPTGQTGTRVDPEAAAARVNGQTDARHEEKEVGIEDLLAVMEEGVSGTEGTGSLGWGWLSAEEAGKRSKKLYRKAAHAQQRMMLLPDDDESGRREANIIHEQIAVLVRRAARLELLATTPPESFCDNTQHQAPKHSGTTRTRQQQQEQQRHQSSSLPGKQPPARHYSSNGSGQGNNNNDDDDDDDDNAFVVPGRVDVFYATEFHGGPFSHHQHLYPAGMAETATGSSGRSKSSESSPKSPGGSRAEETTSRAGTTDTRPSSRARAVRRGKEGVRIAAGDGGGGWGDRRGVVPEAGAGTAGSRPWCSKRVVTVR